MTNASQTGQEPKQLNELQEKALIESLKLNKKFQAPPFWQKSLPNFLTFKTFPLVDPSESLTTTFEVDEKITAYVDNLAQEAEEEAEKILMQERPLSINL